MEQLLAPEAGLALPGQVTRERLSDSNLVPSGHQAPEPPLCCLGSQSGSCGHTLLSAEQGGGADPGGRKKAMGADGRPGKLQLTAAGLTHWKGWS